MREIEGSLAGSLERLVGSPHVDSPLDTGVLEIGLEKVKKDSPRVL